MRKLLLALFAFALTIAAGTAHAGDCGRPLTKNSNVSRASDALFILHSSVGSDPCKLEDCDVNTDCKVTAADALVSLTNSVKGCETHDSCESECPTTVECEDAGAPTCNGVCPEGQACVSTGDDDDDDKRVTICHSPPGNPGNSKTLVVGASAVPAHLGHGDSLGPCEDEGHGHGNCKKAGGCWDDMKSGSWKHDDDQGDDDQGEDDQGDDEDDDACECQPVEITTTTVSATTTTVIASTTTLATPTTTLPTATTTLPEPTTTLATPTTTVVEPTTTLPTPTTTLPSPTTTLPAPTTTLAEPTTTLPAPTTTLVEPTTTLPSPTTTLPVSTTLPEPTTTLPTPTTTLPGS